MNRSLNSFSRLVLVLAFVTTAGQAKSLAALADSWKAEWEQTVAAAKKEGEVSFYGRKRTLIVRGKKCIGVRSQNV